MATRKEPRKYKRNPDWPAKRFRLNGTTFEDGVVVEGEHWERYTTELFPGRPPQLVYASGGDKVSTDAKGKAAKPPVDAPSGTTTASLRSGETVTAGEDKVTISTAPKPAPKPPAPKPAPEPEDEPEDEETIEVDDFTVMDGVGASRADALVEAGFHTLKAIGSADPTVLLAGVRDTGARMNLATARTIVRQAKKLSKE